MVLGSYISFYVYIVSEDLKYLIPTFLELDFLAFISAMRIVRGFPEHEVCWKKHYLMMILSSPQLTEGQVLFLLVVGFAFSPFFSSSLLFFFPIWFIFSEQQPIKTPSSGNKTLKG